MMRTRFVHRNSAELAGAMIATIALAIVLPLAACAPPIPTPAPASIPLRVMTYNIRSGNGDLAATAAAIRALAPDVVALQEVDVHWAARSSFADEAAELGRALGMEVRFAPIYTIPDSADASRSPHEFGVALLSRFPITLFRDDTLTRLSTQAQNASPAPMPGLLDARLDVRGIPVRVFDTHLDYRRDPGVRAQQVHEMLARIGDVKTLPTLVFGDLNAPPSAPELQPLLKKLQDVWPRKNGPGYTYPADAPTERIDYVLVSSHFRVRDVTVAATQASDHRPVVADLQVAATGY